MDLGGIATMGGGGPMVTGQWINQRTGEKVTVRDSYMDGENMYVTLTNGRTITMEEFQDYIQMGDEEYDVNGNKKLATSKPIVKPKKQTYDPNVVFDGLDPKNDTSDLQKKLLAKEVEEFGPTEEQTAIKQESKQQSSSSQDMIMKILDKTAAPRLTFSVEWDEYPVNELKMLKEYFNVSDEDIAKAIISKYVNTEDINKTVTDWVSNTQK